MVLVRPTARRVSSRCPVRTLVCYLRRDLLDQAGLKLPETWEDYHVLLEKLPEWAPGLAAVEPWSEEFPHDDVSSAGSNLCQTSSELFGLF